MSDVQDGRQNEVDTIILQIRRATNIINIKISDIDTQFIAYYLVDDKKEPVGTKDKE